MAKASKAETVADRLVQRRQQVAESTLSAEDQRVAAEAAEADRQDWLNRHGARVARFAAHLRDTGAHPITGESARFPTGTEPPEGYYEAIVERFEEYLLAEAEADANVRYPNADRR